MINNKWMENPVLSDISPEKMEVLTKILNGAGDMDAKQMLTYFIKETNQASKNGINFTFSGIRPFNCSSSSLW